MFLFARHPCIDNPLAYIIFVMPAQQGTQNSGPNRVQGCLAHKKQPLPSTLQEDSAQGPMVVLL